jgi:hypothetical protein
MQSINALSFPPDPVFHPTQFSTRPSFPPDLAPFLDSADAIGSSYGTRCSGLAWHRPRKSHPGWLVSPAPTTQIPALDAARVDAR